jgi:hypothetical protein
VGFAVGGAFLSLAYFDLPYDILAVIVLAHRWMESKGREREVSLAKGRRVTRSAVATRLS